MTNYFISDTHFNHTNIIKFANRPFGSADEMNKHMITRWNARVQHNDTVFFLGDFGWGKTESFYHALNGHKILIEGNHDKNSLDLPWMAKHKYYELSHNKLKLVLFHYPILSWNGAFHGGYHLFGHVHGQPMNIPGHAYDVGVECINYAPRTIEEILQNGTGVGVYTD
jgi:calcineurin-like phosphoesterase family protein